MYIIGSAMVISLKILSIIGISAKMSIGNTNTYGTIQLQLHTRVIAIVVTAELKPWSMTTSGLNPCMARVTSRH